jgi:hypothetical protein
MSAHSFDRAFGSVVESIESLRGDCRAASATVGLLSRELQEARELLKTYRDAHVATIEALTRLRSRSLLKGETVWPCELCRELHPETTRQDAVTCRGCDRRMCRSAFEADPRDWYEEFEVIICDDCELMCGNCVLREASNPRGHLRACGQCGGVCCRHEFREYHAGCHSGGGKQPRN